jgi:hypothetical protein
LFASHDCKAGDYCVPPARHRQLELGVVQTRCTGGKCRNECSNPTPRLKKANIARLLGLKSPAHHPPDGMNGDQGYRGAGCRSKLIFSYAAYSPGSATWFVVLQKG